MKRYDIILFDADGTLYDFDRSEANAVSEVLALSSLPVNDETVTLYHEINDAEWKALERGETTRERLKYDRFRKLKEALSARGITTDVTAEDMCNMYVERLSRQCIPYPEAEPVCRELSSRGCRLYIITNGITAVQHGRFDKSPLTKYFDGMFVSDKMGTVKPERRYFELVLDAVGVSHDEAVSRALVVGDSLTSDIAGAAAAGLDSVWYDPLGRAPGTAAPTYTIRSLYELYDIILPR